VKRHLLRTTKKHEMKEATLITANEPEIRYGLLSSLLLLMLALVVTTKSKFAASMRNLITSWKRLQIKGKSLPLIDFLTITIFAFWHERVLMDFFLYCF